jgi:peptidoglycan-N-acetylglucosamine deacetylase
MQLKLLLLICFIVSCVLLNAQNNVWNNKQCAVVLTYDDAIEQQLINALPVLDSLHLKATFYLTAYFAKNNLNDWKRMGEGRL